MKKDRKWLYIAILSLVIAVTWVVISAVSRLRQTTIAPDVEKAMTPLNPKIDQTVFDDLQKRRGGGI